MEDTALLTGTAAGEHRAFEALYERHAAAVYRYCRIRIRDDHVAADALQETFLAVWRGAAGYHGSGCVAAWIFGIARRQIAEALRRRPPDAPYPLDDLPATAEPCGPGPEPADQRLDLQRALARLPPPQQDAVLLVYGGGLSCAEAAQAAGVPEGTIKSRLHQARRALAWEVKAR